MNGAPTPSDYQGRTRNPTWERELLLWLRQQTEEGKLVFIMDLVKYHEAVALQLAHRVLNSRESFVKMLEFALANRDISTIRFWLDAIIPRLGFRRAVDIMIRLSSSGASGVKKALYWLPRYAESEADQSKLKEFEDLLK